MNQVNRQEFLDLFDPEIHDKITGAVARYPDAEAVVCFENLDMSSSQLGHRSALVVGPSNTFTSVKAAEDKWLNDLPSQRQYPTVYVPVEEFKT